MSTYIASAGTQVSSSKFLSAISTIYDYSYLSSTTTAAATASLSSGTTTAAAYSAATSSASVATTVATIDVRRLNSVLYCAFLAAATNSSNISAANNFNSLCQTLSSPPPPPQPGSPDYTLLAPLIICSMASVLILGVAAVYMVNRFQSDGPSAPWRGVALSSRRNSTQPYQKLSLRMPGSTA